jgi:AT hook motif
MRDILIHWLGGYTQREYDDLLKYLETVTEQRTRDKETIKTLSALVPVSAVTPKKRGRPRKYEKLA